MHAPAEGPVTLTSTWYLKPGCQDAARTAIVALVAQVALEPGTLVYQVHFPWTGGGGLQDLPPRPADTVLFFERYASPQAFWDHFHGAAFQRFVADHGDLFVEANPSTRAQGSPAFSTVQFLSEVAGFVK
ncbi:MAG: antibiotic biosynthesis monooxygenase [Alphaproteobacteria bacterium]|nr:antibiotic biosynthesis monooxygenase [Alphaproteobacteria bacterium]